MKALLLSLLALVLVACGGQAANPPATPASNPNGEGRELPKALGKPRVTVEYVVIHQRWVEKTMTPHHVAKLEKLLKRAGINADAKKFKRYGSARKLYNFHVDNVDAY